MENNIIKEARKLTIRGFIDVKEDYFDSKNYIQVTNGRPLGELGDLTYLVLTNIPRNIFNDYSHSEDGMEEIKAQAPNVNVKFYYSDSEVTLKNAEEYILVQSLGGSLEGDSKEVGYSEFSVDGISSNLVVGGHDILNILKGYDKKFIQLIIEW